MRGIILRDSIRMFGIKHGFPFWFRWSFIDPIQMFVWLNITHKPYCPYHGFGWNTPKCCDRKKLTKKSEIQTRWKKTLEEEDWLML
jgi:hypothetical protein